MNKKLFFLAAVIFFALCLIPNFASSAFADAAQMSKWVIQLEKELDDLLYSLIFPEQKEQGAVGDKVSFEVWKTSKQAEDILKKVKRSGHVVRVTGDVYRFENDGGDLRISFLAAEDKDVREAIEEIATVLLLEPIAMKFTRQLNEMLDERLYALIYGNLKILGKLDNTVALESWKKTEQASVFLKQAKSSGRFMSFPRGNTYLYEFLDRKGQTVGDIEIELPRGGVVTDEITRQVDLIAKSLVNEKNEVAKHEPPPKQYIARGMSAAKLNDWKLAIKYFTQAYEDDREDPVPLFNLALANDKAGGRDFNAIALYNLFLSKFPTAPNSSEVQSRILELEVRLESTTRNLLKKVRSMTEEFKSLSGSREKAFETGNYNLLMYDRVRRRSLSEIAKALAWLGDIDEAVTIPDETYDPFSRARLMIEIAEIAVRSSDLSAAREVLNLAENRFKSDEKGKEGYLISLSDKIYVFSEIAFLRHLAKDNVGSQSAMSQCEEAMEEEIRVKAKNNEFPHDSSLASYAKALAWSGNIEAALEAVRKIKDNKRYAIVTIAKSVAGSGDLGKAKDVFEDGYTGNNLDDDFIKMMDGINKPNIISEQQWEIFADEFRRQVYGKEYADLPQFLASLERESKDQALGKLCESVRRMAHYLYLFKNKEMGYLPGLGY